MKRILIQVTSKMTLLNLKQFGTPELVSETLNIYCMDVRNDDIKRIERIDGVLNVEEDEIYEYQISACQL